MKKQSYFDQVYFVTNSVPPGKVTTYGAIADYLALGSARMVGWALNNCPSGVAAHRVVNRKGELSGRNHWPTPDMMGSLLMQEGVEIENDQVKGFKDFFWHPGDHLKPFDLIQDSIS